MEQPDKQNLQALIEKIRIIPDAAALQSFLKEIAPDALSRPVRIAFVNAHAFNLCAKDSAFLTDIMACDYVLRDGAGMKILYSLLGEDPGLNMNGTDFIPKILDLYKGQGVSLMGTKAPYLGDAAREIANRGLSVTTAIDGFQADDAYVAVQRETPSPLVILAMGMPKQERVAARIAAETSNASLVVCGGAILDFMGGKVVRAPEFFRKTGLEWVYRLAQEPKRLFGRYIIGNAVFLYRALGMALHAEKPHADEEGKIKILHVVRQFHPAIGGLESYVLSMARHQMGIGYDPEILTLDRVFHGDGDKLPHREIHQGLKIRRVGFVGRRRYFLPLISPFYFRKFDVVHVHNTDMFYDYVALIAGATGVKCFATTHGGFFHTKDFSLVKKIYFNTVTRLSSLFYKTIFAISQNDFDTFKTVNKNVVLQHNAVEPLGDEISTGRDFLYIGRLAEHKHVSRVIDVCSRLFKDHNSPGSLHIVGPAWDVSIEDLREKASACGISDRVVFHGAAPIETLRDVAKKCGYFLSASEFEGFGMSMLEGMSVGMIPFVEPNESFKELIGKAGVGLCVDYKNPAAAAAQIDGYLPSVTDQSRQSAMNFARQFAWQGLVENTDRVYRQYMGRRA